MRGQVHFCQVGSVLLHPTLIGYILTIKYNSHRHHHDQCQEGGCRDATGIFRDGGLAQYCRVPAEQVGLNGHDDDNHDQYDHDDNDVHDHNDGRDHDDHDNDGHDDSLFLSTGVCSTFFCLLEDRRSL